MNRRGMTAIADAVFCVILIGISANILMISQAEPPDDGDVQDPGQVLDRLFSGKMEYSDIGVEVEYEGTVGMNRIAYVSLCKEDGRFMEYASGILGEVYPWEGSYRLIVGWDGETAAAGCDGDEPWKSASRTYFTGLSGELAVTLEVFR